MCYTYVYTSSKPLEVNILLPDDGGLECGRAVAAGTVRTKLATVHVILAVARNAGCRKTRICNVFLRVAVIAAQSCVGPRQREVRVTAMIERHFLPTHR